jgi:DNA-binding NarL/FixJ family response regulator
VVAAGEALLAPSVTRRLISGSPPGPASIPAERERQVLLLIARGLSNAEIAQRLHIGEGTAKTHVRRLLTKHDARDRVQLVIYAYRSGLVPADRATHPIPPREDGVDDRGRATAR